ncbi:hypothetical protein ACWPKS_17305 [Coraliomargarita sp. W4R72]
MKLLLCLLAFIPSIVWGSEAESLILTSGSRLITEGGAKVYEKYEYRISKTKFDSLPKYKPSEGVVPLSIEEAIRIATAAQDEHKELKLEQASLVKSSLSPIWYYSIEFYGEKRWGEHYRPIIILLNGEILEQTTIKNMSKKEFEAH